MNQIERFEKLLDAVILERFFDVSYNLIIYLVKFAIGVCRARDSWKRRAAGAERALEAQKLVCAELKTKIENGEYALAAANAIACLADEQRRAYEAEQQLMDARRRIAELERQNEQVDHLVPGIVGDE